MSNIVLDSHHWVNINIGRRSMHSLQAEDDAMTGTARNTHMRRWVQASLGAVIIVSTLCTGAGIGSATTETDTNDGFTTARYSWNVTNATGKTVKWGQFCKVEVSALPTIPSPRSALAFGDATPWQPLKPGDRTADAFQSYPLNPVGVPVPHYNFTSGIVDIDDQLWAVKEATVSGHPGWHETSGNSWRQVWIFWDTKTGTPFLTKEGGGENIPLEPATGDRHGKDNACVSAGM